MTIGMLEPVQVVCAACLAENRVPADRLGEAPVCGKCGAALLDGKPAVLDETSFDKLVAAAELHMKVRFAKVNTDSAQALAMRHRIRGIPTLILYADGRETARTSGAMDKASLVRWIRQHI
jgi:thioredoxin 2